MDIIQLKSVMKGLSMGKFGMIVVTVNDTKGVNVSLLFTAHISSGLS